MQKIIGRVKFFNARKSYGFIRPVAEVLQDATTGHYAVVPFLTGQKDVFVHVSDITPTTGTVFRALYTGELVQYETEVCDAKNKHDNKASNVTGVFGGHLMCEFGRIHFISYSGIGNDNEEDYEPEDVSSEYSGQSHREETTQTEASC